MLKDLKIESYKIDLTKVDKDTKVQLEELL